MTKICHVTSVHNSLDTRIFYKECVSLAKAGYKTYLVAEGESFDKEDVHIVGVGERKGGRLKRIFGFSYKVIQRALALDCEIYHLHDPELLLYALYLKAKGKKVIFDSHEFYALQIKEKEYIPKFFRNLIANIYSLYEKNICKNIDAFIYVCTINGSNYFKNYNVKNINLENFIDISGALKFRLAPKNSSAIYVGGLSESRGILDITQAISKTDVKLILCGAFDNIDLKEKVLSNKNIVYKGTLTKNKLFDELAQSIIGLAILQNRGQYSILDTMPTKVFEYMAFGLPIIVSKTRYNVKFIEENKCGIAVESGNIQEITDAILYLKNNPDIAKQMGENGRRAVKEKYNWGIEEKKLLALYEELARH